MDVQTSDVSICNWNGNKKYPIETSNFTRIFAFDLLYVSIAVANSISSKYYLFLTYFFYYKLAKFGQNRMIRTTQNFDLFWQKPLYYVNISILKSLKRHFERGSACQTNNDAQSISHKASIFHYSKKITLVWHFKPSLKLNYTWVISHVFFETVRTLKFRLIWVCIDLDPRSRVRSPIIETWTWTWTA